MMNDSADGGASASQFAMAEEIRTERLLLRKPRSDDAPLIFNTYAQDPEVTRFLLWRPHSHIAETFAVIDRWLNAWESREEFCWLMFERETAELVGSFAARRERSAFSLGFLLARAYWGRGYMTEAINAVVDYIWANSSADRVWAACDIDNMASARAMEKAGFRREGILPAYCIAPAMSPAPRDCYRYVRYRG